MRPARLLLPALTLLILAAGMAPAHAQEPVRRVPASAEQPGDPSAPAPPLDATLRAAVVEEAAGQLDARYVFPDVGRRLAEHLRQRLRAGAYDAAVDAEVFAEALTRELREAGRDLHLAVSSPAMAGARLGRTPDQTPEQGLAALVARERALNHHFRAVEVRPGNVGYLALDRFPVSDSARATAAAAMAFLAHTDAVILDLRRNPGGVEGVNQFLSSYFFPADTSLVLYTRYYRETDSTTAYRVLADVPGRRFPAIPLYVLTSRQTGSAAENMAYALKTLGRAVIVGERTAGAANSSRIAPLPGGFVLSLPSARVVSPITGTNWEGVGVEPDVATAPERALDEAYALALRTLLDRATGDEARGALQRALDGLQPEANTVAVRPEALARYAGRYGERTLRVENGTLVFQRDGAVPLRLVPLSETTFAFENDPDGRVALELDASGAATAIRVQPPGGAWTTAPRTGN